MSQAQDEEARAITDAIDKLERALIVASENGLFEKRKGAKDFKEIDNHITSALRAIEGKGLVPDSKSTRISKSVSSQERQDKDKPNQSPDPISARKELAAAHRLFNSAVNSAPLRWRLVYEHGVPFFAFLLIIIGALAYVWIFHIVRIEDQFLYVPIWAFSWGVLGSVLQGLWSLWQSVSDHWLRKNWLIWYLAIPPIGGLLGAFTYLAFYSGFIAAMGQQKITNETVPVLLAGLAGFSWKWAINVLNDLTKIFRGGKG